MKDFELAGLRKNRFALIGVAGFIAPKHLKAMRDTDNELVVALDPHDSVGVLDSYFPNARFFTEFERFDRFLEKQRRLNPSEAIDYVSICSPNYLHDAHIRLALRVKAHAICEKPLVINPWNLDQLSELEAEHGRSIHAVLQLRLHPEIEKLKENAQGSSTGRTEICLTYVTRRGRWYDQSWKGDSSKSGGLAMNIGVHFFDFLLWAFGSVERSFVHVKEPRRMAGVLELAQARVRWFLSVDGSDLPTSVIQEGGHAYRSITVDGDEIDLSAGFTDLHTEVYRQILAGAGFSLQDARPAIELIYQIRTSETVPVRNGAHPYLRDTSGCLF